MSTYRRADRVDGQRYPEMIGSWAPNATSDAFYTARWRLSIRSIFIGVGSSITTSRIGLISDDALQCRQRRDAEAADLPRRGPHRDPFHSLDEDRSRPAQRFRA